jgi:hypothetical protein
MTLEESTGEIKGVLNMSDHIISGSLMFNGVLILQTIVLLANVKIFLATNIHTAWSLFWTIGSMAWFYVFFYAESESTYFATGNELQGMFFLQMSFVTTYVLLLLPVED